MTTPDPTYWQRHGYPHGATNAPPGATVRPPPPPRRTAEPEPEPVPVIWCDGKVRYGSCGLPKVPSQDAWTCDCGRPVGHERPASAGGCPSRWGPLDDPRFGIALWLALWTWPLLPVTVPLGVGVVVARAVRRCRR